MKKPLIFSFIVFILLFLLNSCQTSHNNKNRIFENFLPSDDINKSLEIYAAYYNGLFEIQIYNHSSSEFQLAPQNDLTILFFDANNSIWQEIPLSSIMIARIQEFSLTQPPVDSTQDSLSIFEQNIKVDENTIVHLESIQNKSISAAFFVVPVENSMSSISEFRIFIKARHLETSIVVGAYFDVLIKP